MELSLMDQPDHSKANFHCTLASLSAKKGLLQSFCWDKSMENAFSSKKAGI